MAEWPAERALLPVKGLVYDWFSCLSHSFHLLKSIRGIWEQGVIRPMRNASRGTLCKGKYYFRAPQCAWVGYLTFINPHFLLCRHIHFSSSFLQNSFHDFMNTFLVVCSLKPFVRPSTLSLQFIFNNDSLNRQLLNSSFPHSDIA